MYTRSGLPVVGRKEGCTAVMMGASYEKELLRATPGLENTTEVTSH
jgi:hypothetical protein